MFFDAGGVRIRYRFAAERRQRLEIRIVKLGSGRVVRRFRVLRGPGRPLVQRWGGITGGGAVAEDGRYRVLLGRRGARLRAAGGFRFLGHRFPVRGPHWTRGAVGTFGAPRGGWRNHEGFDLLASCGTPLAAARGGRVLRRGHDPILYGWFVLIDGRREHRNYLYAHLRGPPPVRPGQRLRTGRLIGEVGQSGNARSTPCHLHFEMRRGGRPLDPEPALRRWDRYS